VRISRLLLSILVLASVVSCARRTDGPPADQGPAAAPQPPAAQAPAEPQQRELKLTQPRMSGDDIRQLQQSLLAMNFEDVGEADGWYGPMTETAVKKLQRYLGFNEDGIVSPSVWGSLFPPNELVTQFCTDANSVRYISSDDIYGRDQDGVKETLGQDDVSSTVLTWWYTENQDLQCARIRTSDDTRSDSVEVYPVGTRYVGFVLQDFYKDPYTGAPVDQHIRSRPLYWVDGKEYLFVSGAPTVQQRPAMAEVLGRITARKR
jgi:peptidoglycan hydrolase-like protein with peptidoglycan-binding domain